MIFIPASTAWIGCNSNAHCYPEEEPYVQVMLSSYWLDTYEVTRGQYGACVSAGVCTVPENFGESLSQKTDHPVRGVSWSQADRYCRWVGKRLPSVAQWERAARGTSGGVHPWGAPLPDCTRLNYASCVGETTPVGSYPTGATPEGLMDLFGNLWEWTQDDYSDTYYSDIGSVDPVGIATGLGHVFRGGSFSSGDEQAEPWLGYFPDGTIYHERRKAKIGLRCLLRP